MKKQNIPRAVIAGTNSGCGKTTVVCAILQAMVNRKLRVAAFKCGPDYIDPMFHSRIIGTRSSNLDSFFFKDSVLRYLLARNAQDCDISIIEGVMGYYDGLGLDSMRASTYEIARITDSPVILVLNAKGASMSVLAQIYGFLHFTGSSRICGVILNQCTPGSYGILAEAIRKQFAGAVRPLGYLPVMKDCFLESRHLGLVTAAEVKDLKQKLQQLAQQAEKSVDLDGICELAGNASPVDYEPPVLPSVSGQTRIAVARDKAFCFYYEDSLQVLRDMGAELVPFSPLDDRTLPDHVSGMYLGGGYPELYAQQLSRNDSMRTSVRKALERRMPCIAECGGFMYLTEAIGPWSQVGYLRGNSYDTGRLSRFGYVTLTALTDNMLCSKGGQIPAHEFHHWDAEDPGSQFLARKTSGKSWNCVHVSDTLYAGFPHFHFCSNPVFAQRFYEACLAYAQTTDIQPDQTGSVQTDVFHTGEER